MLTKWTLIWLFTSVFSAWYIGLERLGKYIQLATNEPSDFFRIPVCIGLNCGWKMAACMTDSKCVDTLNCINECQLYQAKNKQAMCAYICEMTDGYENKAFEDLMNCMIEGHCMSDYPQDGYCIANDQDADQSLTNIEEIKGDWWVIRGLNCGLDDQWPGGYDWFPCQHERYKQLENGQWFNQISYCAGKDNECLSKGGGAGIKTIANATLPSPGVIRHEYDSALAPQIEYWRVVSRPDKDHMLLYWCGQIPIQNYNGGLLLSRHKSDSHLSEKSKVILKNAAQKFHLNFDNMCISDNSWCPEF